MAIIHPGEYYISYEDIIISTILGSCVGVVIYDPVHKIGGLNHFMLAKALANKTGMENEAPGKYGENAMRILLSEVMKYGTDRRRLVAKVFGGGSVFSKTGNSISRANIDCAFDFLENEKIPIVSSDTGGSKGRKMLFFLNSGKVLVKRIDRTTVAKLDHLNEEEERVTFFNENNSDIVVD